MKFLNRRFVDVRVSLVRARYESFQFPTIFCDLVSRDLIFCDISRYDYKLFISLKHSSRENRPIFYRRCRHTLQHLKISRDILENCGPDTVQISQPIKLAKEYILRTCSGQMKYDLTDLSYPKIWTNSCNDLGISQHL